MPSYISERKPGGFDLLSLGEVMLRLDPGESRIRSARSFSAWEGGGEYNVAKSLSSCFGMKTGVLTAFADNEIGRLLEGLIKSGGTDTSLIKWVPCDGIGRDVRNGLNFTERGFGVRRGLGVSDRGNTAASKLSPSDFDWDYIFGDLGVRVFHTGGIFAALSQSTVKTALTAVKAAKTHGAAVSFDVNFRPSLWGEGGLQAAAKAYEEIISYSDIVFAGANDIAALTGESSSLELSELYDCFFKKFPSVKLLASTNRTVKSASVNSWSASAYDGTWVYTGTVYENLEVLDRVGGGDAFAAGLLYGLLNGFDTATALEYGIAHGALAVTTPGDTSMASLAEVEGLVSGGGSGTLR